MTLRRFNLRVCRHEGFAGVYLEEVDQPDGAYADYEEARKLLAAAEDNIRETLKMCPRVIQCREGGGVEDINGTLALTVGRLVQDLDAAEERAEHAEEEAERFKDSVWRQKEQAELERCRAEDKQRAAERRLAALVEEVERAPHDYRCRTRHPEERISDEGCDCWLRAALDRAAGGGKG